MAPIELNHAPSVPRRPFRALEESLVAQNPPVQPDRTGGGERDREALIGGDRPGTSPRPVITLIGTSGARAPLDPAPPAGSRGKARVRDGAWGPIGDDVTFDDELLLRLRSDRERLTDIARALGACPDCWGERIGCARCGGVGRPGSDDPRADAFDWYVRPLLHRIGAVEPDGPPRRPRPPGSDAHPAGRGPGPST